MPRACPFSISACANISLFCVSAPLEQNVQTTTTRQRTQDTSTDTSRGAFLLHVSLRRRVTLLLIVHGLTTLRRISLRRVTSLLRRVSLLGRHEAAVWVGCGRRIALLRWVVAVLGCGGGRGRVGVVGCCFAAAAVVGGGGVVGWRARGCVLCLWC